MEHRKITPVPAQYGHHKSNQFSFLQMNIILRFSLLNHFQKIVDPKAFDDWLMTNAKSKNHIVSEWEESSSYSHQTPKQWKAANVLNVLAFGNGCWAKWTEMEKALAAKTQPLTYLFALRIETTKSIKSRDRLIILLFLKCRTKFSLMIYLFLMQQMNEFNA